MSSQFKFPFLVILTMVMIRCDLDQNKGLNENVRPASKANKTDVFVLLYPSNNTTNPKNKKDNLNYGFRGLKFLTSFNSLDLHQFEKITKPSFAHGSKIEEYYCSLDERHSLTISNIEFSAIYLKFYEKQLYWVSIYASGSMFNGDFANYPDVIAIAIEKYGAPDVKKVEEYYPESEVSSTGFKPKHKGKPYGRTFLKWQSTQASMSVDLKSEKGSETLMMEYMYIPIIAKLKSDSVVALQNANKKLKQNKKNRTNEL